MKKATAFIGGKSWGKRNPQTLKGSEHTLFGTEEPEDPAEFEKPLEQLVARR